MRLGELAGLRADDVSLDLEMVWVDGKSGMRRAPYTMGTARSLDRYLRARTKHRFARSPWLWIGERETKAGEMRLTKTGIYQMLARRSEKLGIGHINPHMFRHSAADRFITAGVQEGEVMELLGWSRGSRSMLDRYGKSVASRRAIDTYRRLIG
jgi:integrase